MTNLRSGLLCAIAVSGLGFPAWAATFTEFDPSGSLGTYPTAINGGVVTGYYENFFIDAFVRATDGSISMFDAPHATETYPTSINKTGTIAGYYTIDSGVEHGFAPRFNPCTDSGGGCYFVRTPDGVITEFDPVPGQCFSAFWISVNDSGVLAGSCWGNSSFVLHGFLRRANGTTTTFDPPGSTYTQVSGINQRGMITGWYNDSSKGTHGFVRAHDGSITTFDVPNSTYTFATSINRAGTVVGDYFVGNSSSYHGFARTADGTITTFDTSGSADTFPVSIANSGAITGYYTDTGGNNHGFIRKNTGTIISFDPPGANQTFPASTDSDRTDKNVITGYYEDSSGQYHGFIRTP